MSDLQIHGFETSNNLKVRVGLGFKGLAYRFHTIEPSDRTTVLQLSGQHLTPVLQHGDVVLFDSAAILRYLEARFPDAPKLFGTSLEEQWEIEDWELFARARLAGPMLELVHTRVTGGEVDDALIERCSADWTARIEELAGRMAGREWLVGGGLTAADVTAAPVLWRVQQAGLFQGAPIPAELASWRDRVMSFDGPGRLE